jgi:hypothetical protein
VQPSPAAGARVSPNSARPATAPERRPRLDAEPPVAGAVGEHARREHKPILRARALRHDFAYPAIRDACRRHGGVEPQPEIRLRPAELEEDDVGHRRGALRVAHRQFEPDFLDQAAFARLQLERPPGVQARRPDDVHADLAGGVAAEDRPILHQNHARAEPRGGHRAAHAGQAAAGHQQIAFLPVLLHDAHREVMRAKPRPVNADPARRRWPGAAPS